MTDLTDYGQQFILVQTKFMNKTIALIQQLLPVEPVTPAGPVGPVGPVLPWIPVNPTQANWTCKFEFKLSIVFNTSFQNLYRSQYAGT
jgi:hypothetical protein